VLDVRDIETIELDFLKAHEETLVKNSFVLFCTGWDKKWGHEDYFKDYPSLSVQASAWLAQFNLKGVGVDAISIDAADVTQYTVHHNLLSKSMIVIENCRGLERLIGKSFQFHCFPLAIRDADGSPVRAVAIL
jgi:kynurenine formamidase